MTVMGVIVFAFVNYGATPHPSKETYGILAVGLFNFWAIVSLFYILYRSEKNSAEEFGRKIRLHIATIVVALLLSMLTTAHDIVSLFNS